MATVKECIGCGELQGDAHKSWCPVITGTLNPAGPDEPPSGNKVTVPQCAHCGQPEGEKHHGLCAEAVPPRRRLTAPTQPRSAKALDKGVPYRHTRNKVGMLLSDATESQLREALMLLADRDPRPVLDALAIATDPDKPAP